jgi:hypothetical protein
MINFGGAYLQKEMKGVLGFIVRDRKGSQVTTGAGRISVLHHALSDACQVNFYLQNGPGYVSYSTIPASRPLD